MLRLRSAPPTLAATTVAASLALAACAGEPTANTILRPPPVVEGRYTGAAQIDLTGTAGTQALAPDVVIELQPIAAPATLRGTVRVGLLPTGQLVGSFNPVDSTATLQRLGPQDRATLTYAAWLPAVLPECDWDTAELASHTAKFTLPRLTITGELTVTCTSETLGGTAAPSAVAVAFEIVVQRPLEPPPGS